MSNNRRKKDSLIRKRKTNETHHNIVEGNVPRELICVGGYVGNLLQVCSIDCLDCKVSLGTNILGVIIYYSDCQFFIEQYFDNSQEIHLDGTDTVPYEIMEFCNELRYRIAQGEIQSIIEGAKSK